MTRFGMDVDVVTAHGTTLKNIGDSDIPGLVQRVNSLVGDIQSNWWGPDAQRFHSDWTGTDQPALTAIGHAITTYGQLAVTNAQAQSQASSAGGASV
jgi:uncharacterized protein YukE